MLRDLAVFQRRLTRTEAIEISRRRPRTRHVAESSEASGAEIMTATGYSAYVPDLPGCVAAGTTLQETEQLIREALELHLEAMRADGDPIPEPTTVVSTVTVVPAA